MSRKLILVGMSVALVAVFAWAQERTGGQMDTHGQHMLGSAGWAKSTDLVGKECRDAQGNKIGDVKNLVIDMSNGHCLFAIIPGSYVDKKDQEIAVPLTALKLSNDAKYLTCNVDKNQLASAPAFNEKNWPNMTDPNFVNKVYTHFNVTYPMGMEPARQAGSIEREQPSREPMRNSEQPNNR